MITSPCIWHGVMKMEMKVKRAVRIFRIALWLTAGTVAALMFMDSEDTQAYGTEYHEVG